LEPAGADFPTTLDPQLQAVLLHDGIGNDRPVDVVLRLCDPGSPMPAAILDERRIGGAAGTVVTGRVPKNQIVALRRDPSTRSLKAAPEARLSDRPRVDVELGLSGPDEGSAVPDGIDGRGVIVGIVDFGIDYDHPNFRDPADPARSRMLCLWDQNSRVQPDAAGTMPDVPYGRVFERHEIEAAIASGAPGALGGYTEFRGYFLDPQTIPMARRAGAHGTLVADLALGNGAGTGTAGIAPGADLVFVQLANGNWQGAADLASSRHILDAVDFVFRLADQLGRPAVVNVSLGTNGGPHDGSSPVERAIDELVAAKPGRAVVVSAGNVEKNFHTAGTVVPGAETRIGWMIRQHISRNPELEIWYGTGEAGDPSALSIRLLPPPEMSAAPIGPFALGTTTTIRDGAVTLLIARVYHRRSDPNNGLHHVDIVFEGSRRPGEWTVILESAVPAPVPFHAWIERDMSRDASFLTTVDATSRRVTLGSLACGSRAIVVGGVARDAPGWAAWDGSGQGPTRDHREKPDLVAPGVQVPAARSEAHDERTRNDGTSFAAPIVTGAVALMMQAAGRPLAAEEIRSVLRETARPVAPASGWDDRTGAGVIDIAAAVARVRPVSAD